MNSKPRSKCQFAGAFLFVLFALPLLAEGPSDLEALAKKAREAAGQEVAQPPVPQDEVAEAQELEVDPKQLEVEPVPPIKQPDAEVVPVAEEAAVEVDLAKRNEALGLISRVSPRATGVFSLSNGSRIWEEFNESYLGQIALERLAENDIDLTSPDGPGDIIGSVLGEQILFVVGEGTPAQTKNLISLNRWNDKFQFASFVSLLDGGLLNDALGARENAFGSLFMGLQSDPDFLVNTLSASEMPPILLAAKVSDDEMREVLASGLSEGIETLLAMGMPFLTAVNFEAGGVTFQGVSLDGEALIETFGESMNLKQSFEVYLDPAAAQDAVNTLKEKDLVIASGSSDDGIFLYLASRVDDIPLLKEGEVSLTSSEAFAFVDPYLDETLLGVNWVSESLVGSVYSDLEWLGSSIDGLLLGLESDKTLGDTDKLKTLLGEVQKLEKTVLSGYKYQPTGTVSFLTEKGLQAESFGGVIDPNYDWATPFTMSSQAQDSFLTVQAIENRKAADGQVAYLEGLSEAAYEMANVIQRAPQLPDEAEKFIEGFAVFNETMKTDAVALWQGLRGSEKGFGVESIFEIDLKGTWPTIPNVPEVVIEKGAAPRISIARTITDRAALEASWKEIEGAAGKLLKTVGEQAGQNIPMQKPMSSTSDGLKTWFYPIPMQTDDFVPSLTIDDKFAIFGTSKNRAIELAEIVKKAPGKSSGVRVDMQFAPLQAFLENWLTIIAEDPAEIIKDEEALKNYLDSQKEIQNVVEALGGLQSYSYHLRLEDGVMRQSTFLNTKPES